MAAFFGSVWGIRMVSLGLTGRWAMAHTGLQGAAIAAGTSDSPNVQK